MIDNFSKKITSKKALLLGLAFFYQFTSAQANPTKMNYAQMASSLATIPLGIAAERYDQQGEVQKAEKCRLTLILLNIFNGMTSIYNNLQGQAYQFNGTSYFQKDILVPAGFLLRDFTHLYRHLSEYLYGKIEEKSDDDDDFKFIEEEANQPSQTTDFWKSIGFPTLKGLTAFAVACTQEYTTRYSGKQERNLATAAYSFVRISEEYQNAKPRTKTKEYLRIVLYLNAIWLVYEFIQCYWLQEPKMAHRQGQCAHCVLADDNEVKDLYRSRCGHFYCKTCLMRNIEDPTIEPDRARCVGSAAAEHGCRGIISKNEIRELTNNDPSIMRKFDKAGHDRQVNAKSPLALAEMRARGGMLCPSCKMIIIKDKACNHITCPCGHQFCYRCGMNWRYHFGACGNERDGYLPQDPRPGEPIMQ